MDEVREGKAEVTCIGAPVVKPSLLALGALGIHLRAPSRGRLLSSHLMSKTFVVCMTLSLFSLGEVEVRVGLEPSTV